MEFRSIATSAAVLLSLQLCLPAPAQAEKHELPGETSGAVGSIGSGAMPPNETRSHVFGVDEVINEIETGA